MLKKLAFLFLTITFITGGLFIFSTPEKAIANEEKIKELEGKIGGLKDQRDQIQKEIDALQQKVSATSAEAGTIDAKVKQLKATQNKIQKDISLTQNQIKKSQLTLEKLDLEISDKQLLANRKMDALADSLRQVNLLESESLIENILGYEDLSEFWNQIDSLNSFGQEITSNLDKLRELNAELRIKHSEESAEIKELETSQKLLSGQKEVVADTANQQNKLLSAKQAELKTQQQILNEKIEQRKKFESAMLDFESQIKTLVDPDSFPTAGRGVLSWPLDKITITQQFGGTQFAKNNPGVYGRPFHNGVDFGTPTGTQIKSVLAGTVQATGNTDAFPGCVSWGKWILVKHNNGLTSLYAHLSSILVDPGQSVDTGSLLGLSGSTGYSTGPHLHLTLYASQGVSVVKFSEFKPGATGCSATGASTPVASLDAYIDPMSYLPQL
ncbi:MAG: peptidoglycan DD-metalloendopeptidase family protein [Candidatus Pacebacteria bacterium]|nr:peptidoglycan DD-metalloendopeptidase family protein [Candidatus Paceibacterota bacterium]